MTEQTRHTNPFSPDYTSQINMAKERTQAWRPINQPPHHGSVSWNEHGNSHDPVKHAAMQKASI